MNTLPEPEPKPYAPLPEEKPEKKEQPLPSPREIDKWKGLTPTQREILKRIRRHSGNRGYRQVSNQELAEELGVDERTIRRNVDFLVKRNLLIRKSQGKITHGPTKKNSYRVVRQIYKESKDSAGKVTIQPGLDFVRRFYIGKTSGQKAYLNPPDEEHNEPYVTHAVSKPVKSPF
jgi:predicted transcriptional regulator